MSEITGRESISKPLIAFDFDGTLSDSLPGLTGALNRCLKEFSFPILPDETIRSFVGNGIPSLVQRTLSTSLSGEDDRCVDPGLEKRFLDSYIRIYSRHCLEGTSLYEGVPEMLDDLAANYTLILITNKMESITRTMLDGYGISGYFTRIIGGDSYPWRKPDKRIFEQVQQDLPLSADQCTMIGDSTVDLIFARNAGLSAIACLWGYGNRDELLALPHAFSASRPRDISDFLLHP